MPKYTWMMLAALSAGVVGCASDDLDDNGATRQEGDVNISGDTVNQRSRSAVLGETTGDGRPRDQRTGGAVTGDDVAPAERLDDARRVREAAPTGNTGPIPVDPEPSRERVEQ